MNIVRPIRVSDLEQYEKLAFGATLGIINLPKDKKLLEKKVQNSLEAFQSQNPKVGRQDYCFVLENLETGEIGGTSAIFSRTGIPDPLVYYRLEKEILKPMTYKTGPTEICALYIDPEWRKEGLGKLLSLSRLLFIANFPERFEEEIFAEMRGIITEDGKVPFWEGLRKQLIDADYTEIVAAQEMRNRKIYEAMQQTPIRLSSLPKEAQEAVGKTHENTKPALNMLLKEGFHLNGEVDLDGGPRILAKTQEIATIQNSQVAKVIIHRTLSQPMNGMLCNTSLDFRSCYGSMMKVDEKHVQITEETAKALHVKEGEQIRYLVKR